MKHVRRPWMIRAAFAVIGVGLILIAWSVFAIWLYRLSAGVAPEWMLVRGRGGNLLQLCFWAAYVLTAMTIAWSVTAGLFRLLRVPPEALNPGGGEDYPLHRRRLSPEARARQDGYFDARLRRFGEVGRSPLTPPARKRD